MSLLIRGGRVMDASATLDGVMDLLIDASKIVTGQGCYRDGPAAGGFESLYLAGSDRCTWFAGGPWIDRHPYASA